MALAIEGHALVTTLKQGRKTADGTKEHLGWETWEGQL